MTGTDDPNRVIEVALNLYDVASRCVGETIAGRLSIPSEVTMRVGAAIPVSRYMGSETQQTSRRGIRRNAIDSISKDLGAELADLSL